MGPLDLEVLDKEMPAPTEPSKIFGLGVVLFLKKLKWGGGIERAILRKWNPPNFRSN